ncbi:MAG: MFS transporter, partial [Gammaproteobacteria bacterium]|nr:MFS transporter [Gammaproteobacteria bacterium]
RVIADYGWQAGYLVIGAFIACIAVPVIALLLQDKPPVVIPHAQDVAQATNTEVAGLTLHESLRTVAFWKIAIGFFLVSGVVAALIINLIPLLVDRGLDREQAAKIAGAMGIAVLIGRVGIGSLLDRFSGPLVARVLLALCAVGCFTLTLPDLSHAAVIACTLSLGLAAAAEVDLVAFLTSRFFGMRAYGKIYGWQLTAFYIGAALGPLGAGLAFDHFQSYVPTLYFAAASMAFGALVTGSLGNPPRFED